MGTDAYMVRNGHVNPDAYRLADRYDRVTSVGTRYAVNARNASGNFTKPVSRSTYMGLNNG